MRCSPLLLVLGLVFPASASAEIRVSLDTTTGEVEVVDFPGFSDNVVTVHIAGGSVEVRDTGPGADPTTSDPDCSAIGDTVSCTLGMSPTPFVNGNLGDGNDSIALTGIRANAVDGGDGADNLAGGALDDVLRGGLGADVLHGGDGADTLYGDAVGDSLEGGPGSGDSLDGGDGPDVFTDSGGGGTVTYLNQITNPAGVEVTLDGAQNDGNLTQDGGGDNVGAGITHVQGSQFADELEGGPTPDFLSGAGGDDRLVGNGGADSFNGAAGDDRIEARDGAADADIDCDNSLGTHGAADVAMLDAADPTARNCETSDRGGGGGGGENGDSYGGGPIQGATVAKTVETIERARMPNAVGKSVNAARTAVLARVAGVDLDVLVQRGCGQSQDLEVLRQRPAAGSLLQSWEGSDVPVRLYVCVADRDFLADCDLSDLRNDVKALPRRQDADVALAFVEKFGRCKVDYDLRLTRQAEEARVALEAQKAADAKRARAEIRAAIDCPTTPEDQDLRMILTEGYIAALGFFGLHSSGPDGWTLAARADGEFTSYVDVYVTDRVPQAVNATLYIDGESAGIRPSSRDFPRQSAQRVEMRKGYARLLLSPTRAGEIRICAVLRTGDDQALTAAVRITVVKPSLGDTWETISGRRLKITENGAREQTQRARAQLSGINEIWDFLVSLFSGRSKSIDAAARESSVRAEKVRSVQGKWAAAQSTLDGTLDANPVPPTIKRAACIGVQKGGRLLAIDCPVLAPTGGSVLLGASTDGAGVVAAGAGNVLSHNGGPIVAAGAGNLIGVDGGGLIGLDGAGLIGLDGAGLIWPDDARILDPPGATMVAAGAGNFIPARAQLVGVNGSSFISENGGALIGPDGAGLTSVGGLGLVSPGALG